MADTLPPPVAWKCDKCGNTCDCEGALIGDNWCGSCTACGTMQPLYTAAQVAQALASLTAERDALRAGLDAALDFAGTVGGGSSWWDDVWAEHEARIDAARGGEKSA